MKGLCPFKIIPPPHDRNIYPYHGEGDKAGSQENRRFFWVLILGSPKILIFGVNKGGEVDKQPPRRTKLEPAKAGEGKRIR